MVAFVFSGSIVRLVENGAKRQSIEKRVSAKIGESLQLYGDIDPTGTRKLVHPDPVCTGIAYIVLSKDGITLGGRKIPDDQAYLFACAEGFLNVEDLLISYNSRYNLPFQGWLHTWAVPNLDIHYKLRALTRKKNLL